MSLFLQTRCLKFALFSSSEGFKMLFRDKDLPSQSAVDSNETVLLETNIFHTTR